MKTEFLVITEQSSHVTDKHINEIVATRVYFLASVQLASSRQSSHDGIGNNWYKNSRPAEDIDLFKAWPHATVKRKHGVYATKELLKEELISRGYELNESKNRWYKSESE